MRYRRYYPTAHKDGSVGVFSTGPFLTLWIWWFKVVCVVAIFGWPFFFHWSAWLEWPVAIVWWAILVAAIIWAREKPGGQPPGR